MDTQVPEATSEAAQLTLTAQTLFTSGSKEIPLLSSDRTVEIKTCSMRNIGVLVDLIEQGMKKLKPGTLETVFGVFQAAMQNEIAQGRDPKNIVKNPEELVVQALGNSNIVLEIFRAIYEFLPKAIPAFSDLTEEDYLDLPPDDGMLVAMSVLSLNYDFFSRRLPPIFMGFILSRVGNQGAKGTALSVSEQKIAQPPRAGRPGTDPRRQLGKKP